MRPNIPLVYYLEKVSMSWRREGKQVETGKLSFRDEAKYLETWKQMKFTRKNIKILEERNGQSEDSRELQRADLNYSA